jgi:hypothetical protein
MGQLKQRINMFDPAVFGIRVNGRLRESWSDYFGAQSMSVQEDEAGRCTTLLISEPVDQAALIGMINYLYDLGLPLVSVVCLPTSARCLPASVENRPTEQDNA